MIQAFLVSQRISGSASHPLLRRGIPIMILRPQHGNLCGKSESGQLLDKPESVLLAKRTHGIQCGAEGVHDALQHRSQAIGDRRTRSSAVEHYVDIVGVTGSIPVASTILARGSDLGFAPPPVRRRRPNALADGRSRVTASTAHSFKISIAFHRIVAVIAC